MKGANIDRGREAVKLAVTPGPDCIPLERVDDTLTSPEREHVASCPRCQAERAVWETTNASNAEPNEGAATRWIVAELQRRRSAQPTALPAVRMWDWVRFRGLATAAILVLGATVAYFAWDREASIRQPQTSDHTYRTSRIEPIEPVGSVQIPPTRLKWVAFAGATGYNAVILEVDGTVLWRGSSPTNAIDLPTSVVARLVPGKAVLWKVSATDASGVVIAESSTEPFRVALKPANPGD